MMNKIINKINQLFLKVYLKIMMMTKKILMNNQNKIIENLRVSVIWVQQIQIQKILNNMLYNLRKEILLIICKASIIIRK